MQWFVPPETVRVTFPDGDWIDLKKRITIGERHRVQNAAMKGVSRDGGYTTDFTVLAKAEVMLYLVAWSARGPTGEPLRIDTPERLMLALDALPEDDFDTISKAVSEHVSQMSAAREAEKNGRAEVKPTPATSLSAV